MDLEAACIVINRGSELFGIDTEHCMLEEHNSKLWDLLCNIQPVLSPVLATFEDNKIQSAELTSESDKFIHILYGIF